jgi:hypothetical protein
VIGAKGPAVETDALTRTYFGDPGPNEIDAFRSGLDTLEALNMVTEYASSRFQRLTEEIAGTGGGGAISTKLASEMPAQLVTGLLSPITVQIDPFCLAEIVASRMLLATVSLKGPEDAATKVLESLGMGCPARAGGVSPLAALSNRGALDGDPQWSLWCRLSTLTRAALICVVPDEPRALRQIVGLDHGNSS